MYKVSEYKGWVSAFGSHPEKYQSELTPKAYEAAVAAVKPYLCEDCICEPKELLHSKLDDELPDALLFLTTRR